jgi:hypothetical protein
MQFMLHSLEIRTCAMISITYTGRLVAEQTMFQFLHVRLNKRQGQGIPRGGLIRRRPDVATVVCSGCRLPSSRRQRRLVRIGLGRVGDLRALRRLLGKAGCAARPLLCRPSGSPKRLCDVARATFTPTHDPRAYPRCSSHTRNARTLPSRAASSPHLRNDPAAASLERGTSHRLPQHRALPAPLPRRAITVSITSHAAHLPVYHGVAPVNRSRNHLPPLLVRPWETQSRPESFRRSLSVGSWSYDVCAHRGDRFVLV